MKLLIFRTILIYLCVLFAMRLMGKRQLGELQPEELVSTILISNLASISIESEDVPVTASLIPLFLIAALELLGSALSFRSQKFFNLLSGRPKTVILNGEIDQTALRTLRLTVADLMEALRGKDVFDPRDVSYAVIETNGTLSVALRPEKEPARLSDLQLRAEHCHATIPFVLDGQVLEDNLHWCGKDRAWLERTAQANTLLPQEILLLVGSEVPIPGGATEAEDTLAVTKPEAFRDTVSTYQRVWTEEGVGEGMKDVIAVVVQPGVEFGDEQVFDYNPAAAVDLCAALKEFPDICFEGHSTDYQTATDLYNMVTDGIAILKVGPALTFGLREALFSLSMMEKELVPEEKRANFIETLDQVMLASPANWEKHYHGDEKHLAQCRKYSYSDRARYYIGQPEVVAAMNKLFDNLREYPIPMNMLHQYMPISYAKIREGQLKLDPRELAMDGIVQFMLDYESAV